jgi:BASS family bile acid:Na+ symporter
MLPGLPVRRPSPLVDNPPIVDEALQRLLGFTLVIFMVGNLLEVGLRLPRESAVRALRHLRFTALSLLWAFILCPALAWLLAAALPLPQPYAVGLLLLGMAPCAPFLPVVAERARGDVAYVAAFTALCAAGTVVYMPLAAPVLVPGFTADPWTIARPLVLFILLPLIAGGAVRWAAEAVAERAHPVVRRATGIDTVLMLAVVLWIYRADMIGAVGTSAVASQLLFYAITAAGAYRLGFGLSHGQRSVLALGVCTRNIGAAFAPLVAVPGTDRRAIAMVALAVPLSVACGVMAARIMARRPAGRDLAGTAP